MTNEATQRQVQAARPNFSTWLGANAGSGKTRVLTNRVARLLLSGVDPQNILCLTYTKAAASEMQNRLFQTLGKWAMLSDEDLTAELVALGEQVPEDLSGARTLFASAIETPGGLKIQTIHAFCASVLRRFPVEAGVSPQFRELDERGQSKLIDDTIEDMAVRGDSSLADVARIFSGESLTKLARTIVAKRSTFHPPQDKAAIFAKFGCSPNQTEGGFLEIFQPGDMSFLGGLAPLLYQSANRQNDLKLARNLEGLSDPPTYAGLLRVENGLMTQAGTVSTKQTNAGFRAKHNSLDWSRFDRIRNGVGDQRQDRLSFEGARRTEALHAFANQFLPAYARAKTEQGALDFDDQIEKTRALLADQSLSWVLYKLDGRIEHVLVDEAQDTSPAQWSVIRSLSNEIVSGEGAVDRPRTVFVVGDKKQSIYSFQGADADAFDRMENTFRSQLSEQPGGLVSLELRHSFRSAPAILAAVDATFATNNSGLGKEAPRHEAFHNVPGRVDVWPLVPQSDKAQDVPWHSPVDEPVPNAPPVVLGRKLAQFIKDRLEKGSIPGEGGKIRPIRPDDFLVLVQRRSILFNQIIRHCKQEGLPIAGSDRLKIGGELAVKDLLALMSFLALPDDDLSLAAALRSPLFGWSEQELFALAHGRGEKRLWQALRQSDHPDTQHLSALLGRVDFLRPFELLDNIMTAMDGRRKLMARLGQEAQDGIDELLSQALVYEREEIPTLGGFVEYAQSDENEVKRQAEQGDGLIRVMTVHGAKGLEAPIVILPDTQRGQSNDKPKVILGRDNTPIWRSSSAMSTDVIEDAKAVENEAEMDERQRLLYVAMTRAERWLIVCGAVNEKTQVDWHSAVQKGLESENGYAIDTPTGDGIRLSNGYWPDDTTPRPFQKLEHTKTDVPVALREPAPAYSAKTKTVAPSDLGGAKILGSSGDADYDEQSALQRGRRIHALLEHLADAPVEDRHARAEALLSSGPDALADPADLGPLLAEAERTLDAHPDLFSAGALSEVDVTAHLPTLGRDMQGTIDRLIITDDEIRAVDFKSNSVVPDQCHETPEAILRQMGTYLEALEQIWPDRPITLEVLWTQTAARMVLPHAIVREALQRAQHLDGSTADT